MSNYVAYYRVSTEKQGMFGLGIAAQKETVKHYLREPIGVLIAEYEEVESGKNDNRPQLQSAIEYCELSGATLLIAKLDRLSRNVAFLANLMETNIKFIACDNPQANELTIHILAAVAQEERNAISLRTKAALKQAKARGVKLGNPRLEEARAKRDIPDCLRKANIKRSQLAQRRAVKVTKAIKVAKAEGCSTLRQIANYLNEKTHIRTARGGNWTAVAISRVLHYQSCTLNFGPTDS